MKTKEELLKIYSAYLPYKLKIETESKSTYTMLTVYPQSAGKTIGLMTGEGLYSADYVKPILYSMEMLTQEIEHKGEKFMPTKYLRDNCGEFDISKQDMETLISMFLHVFRSPFSAPYYFIEKLLEWHFNVFGLDESEYIKK